VERPHEEIHERPEQKSREAFADHPPALAQEAPQFISGEVVMPDHFLLAGIRSVSNPATHEASVERRESMAEVLWIKRGERSGIGGLENQNP
jgi:hypothetical protein